MTALCQQCKRPEPHTYLCDNCTTQLANMLDQLPWLLDELDARIQQLARITHGTIGRVRRPNELNVMDFDAADTARKTRKKLVYWVETVAERHTGRKPPALGTVATKALARWLYVNADAIARLDCAGQVYHDINKLVGRTDTESSENQGQLVRAIDRHEKHFAGPCPTIRAHNRQGEPITCATILYAEEGDRYVTCPRCDQRIDAEENRRKAAADRDLLTKAKIIEALDNAGESVTEATLDRWIKARRLRRRGWLHNGSIVQFRIHANDPAVYSLARARKLRGRDQKLTRQKASTT
ncbi:hypothetical protein [Mycolicibacterium elephantis]|uniref:hypothetical protein n=1 Tax=Mycolicibacterium elephantis TaxID=81858 RepID=UPI0007E93DD0|nr:hypothetical protein [Mycolicibacterium elephantis]OBB20604.1 DUF1922 domain-containing protein [Mycolicibacterium elephantis]